MRGSNGAAGIIQGQERKREKLGLGAGEGQRERERERGPDGEETEGGAGKGAAMHPPCSSPPPLCFFLSPPLCSPATPSLSCSLPSAVLLFLLFPHSLLPSGPSLSTPPPLLTLAPPSFSPVLRCLHRLHSFYAPPPLPSPTIDTLAQPLYVLGPRCHVQRFLATAF